MLAKTWPACITHKVGQGDHAEKTENQIQLFSYIPVSAKYGATGNFNAHHVAIQKPTG